MFHLLYPVSREWAPTKPFALHQQTMLDDAQTVQISTFATLLSQVCKIIDTILYRTSQSI